MSLEIVYCPELVAPEDRACDAPAEIFDSYAVDSTDEPILHVRTRCLGGHVLHMPAYMLKGVPTGTRIEGVDSYDA